MLKRYSFSKSAQLKQRHPQVSPVCLMVALLLSSTWLAALPALAGSPPASTVIDNQATGSFVDSIDNTEKAISSNTVSVTVAEVTGITITPANTPSAATGSTAKFDFTVTNVGNDPTQFFIPDAPSAITGGTAGTLQIVAYDPDGSGPAAAVDLTSNNITVPAGGQSTGTLLSAIAAANNGSIPAGASIVVRVPVTVTAANGQPVTVTLGNTSGQPSNSNTPYVAGSKDLYTVDNADSISGESAGAPVNGDATNHRQEASAIQTVTVSNTINVSGTLYRDNDRSGTNTFEPGIGAVRVILYKDNDNNGEIDTTSEIIQQVITLADGSYQFTNVPAGTYKIKVDIANTNVPLGYTLGTSDNLPVTVNTTSITGQDFGFYPAPTCNWDAQVYTGHFPVSGTQASDTGAVGFYGTTGLPTLRGTAKFGAGIAKFTFNDQSISQNADVHPLRTIKNGSFPSQGYVPINGDFTRPSGYTFSGNDDPNWAIVFKRQVPTNGRVIFGQPGAYIDDAMEIYVNGVRVGTPILTYTTSLPANQVSTVAVNAGDIVEIRLSNYGYIGGFFVTTDFVYDFGDAPASYGEVGHAPGCGNPTLGATATGESSQAYSANADADGGDDGVTLPSSLTPGMTATITVNASAAGFLNSWIDFNKNGVFDSDEQVSLTNVTNGTAATINNVPLNAGNNTLTFTVPSNAVLGSSFARFRYTTSTVATPSPTGSGDAGEVEDYPVAIAVPSTPKILLVKRITAINGSATGRDINGNVIDFNQFVDDTNTTDDNAPNWTSGYLKGAIDAGIAKVNDELEYTIYFLSNGTSLAKNALICDRIPTNATFLPTAFNSGSFAADPAGLPGAERGIVFSLGGSGVSLSNVGDGDRAQFFPAGVEPTTIYPKINCGGTNTNGEIVVNLGDLPNATASGVPTSSYGFVRFRATVK